MNEPVMDQSAAHHVTDVLVVGAGLAGLATAQLCRRAGLSVRIVDPHVGGRARSDMQSGFVFNRGPHAVYLGGATERVLGQLGVAFAGKSPGIHDAVLIKHGEQFPIPFTAGAMLRSRYLGLKDKASLGRLFARLPKMKPEQYAHVSVRDLLSSLTERAADVAGLGIRTSTYSAAFDQLSADVAITAMQAPGVRYIDGGWQTLVDGLSRGLAIESASVTSVGDGEVVGTNSSGEQRWKATTVVLAVGTPQATSALVSGLSLSAAPPIEAASLDVGSARPSAHQIVLSVEEPLYFSSHTPAANLAPSGSYVFHAEWYYAPEESIDHRELKARLERHLVNSGVSLDSILASRYLHRMTVVGALPTAQLGGMGGRPSVDTCTDRSVLMVGDWVGPEGQLADAAFASAEQAAHALVKRASSVVHG
jgi:glycine/D-amino acid oxidase-like deaminating enzyme